VVKWLIPPRIKVFEALGVLADKRIELIDSGAVDFSGGPVCNEAKVFSSSRGKYYTVKFDPTKNAIMSNDNGSYWKGYLGYPAIAFLMVRGLLKFNNAHSVALGGILWKDLNQKFMNDFSKIESVVFALAKEKGVNKEDLVKGAEEVLLQLKKLDLGLLGEKTKPPEGY